MMGNSCHLTGRGGGAPETFELDEAARPINRGPRDTWRPTRAPPVLGIKMFRVATRSKREAAVV